MIWGTLDPFVEDGPILGRRVANSTFLAALLQADPYDAYHFYLSGDSTGDRLKTWLQEHFPALMKRGAISLDGIMNLRRRLSHTPYHCMHLSDIFTRYTRLTQSRNAYGTNIFPVTGVTHSLSYTHFMPEYFSHLWPGVSSRDAVIVTSESARLVLRNIFDRLRREYGLDETAFPAPRLVTIPLGLAPEGLPTREQHWTRGGRDNPGLAMRHKLGLGDKPVFLYFGRICPASKMDLIPLFAAFSRARRLGLSPKEYSLLLAGWADEGDPLPEALCSYAKAMGINALVFPRPDSAQRLGLFAAADIFVSPSDNLQETFGLAVAEAGAAGLPVVASDFDGYRDIVLHGETGLLVPTLGFASSGNVEEDSLWWYDNQYHMRLAQECVVDVPAMAAALADLGTNAEKRLKMGEAARGRVLERFSWREVIRRYVALWDEMAATPLAEGELERLRAKRHPLRMRFAEYFKGHFSRVLDSRSLEGMHLQRTDSGEALYRDALPMLLYAGLEHMLDQEAVKRLLLTTRKPIPATHALATLVRFFEEKSGSGERTASADACARENAEFTLLWCLKQDHVEII